jgi:serine/threonine-protein kinase
MHQTSRRGDLVSSTSYRILGRWAAGGMADLYLARQRAGAGFDKVVALKLIREGMSADDDLREMFLAEARIAALLSHPGIVQTFDAGEIAGRAYMAMEFIDGEPLNRFHRAVIRRRGSLAAPLAVCIARDVAAALDYAHHLRDLAGKPLGLVHRDVSPANIMLSFGGTVKLLDFGVAKVETPGQQTHAGVIKGKLGYIAPEQLRGERVDARADVYAVGLVLWQLLTGRRAFDAANAVDLFYAVMTTDLPVPSLAGGPADPALDAIVGGAIRRDRDDRTASAEALVTALGAWLGRVAPGYEPGREVRELMHECFPEKEARLQEVLSKDEGVDLDSGRREFPDALVQNLAQTPSSGVSANPGTDPFGGDEDDPFIVVETAAAPSTVSKTHRPVRAAVAAALLVLGAVGGWLVFRGAGGPSAVRVESEPPGAEVRLDGDVVGAAPIDLTLPDDRARTVTVSKRGFAAWTRAIAAGARSPILAKLQKTSETGAVLLRSRPLGATVQVDGSPWPEPTPTTIRALWVGESHEITVSLDGYKSQTASVEFGDDAFRELDLALATASPPTVAVASEAPSPSPPQRQHHAARVGRSAPRVPGAPAQAPAARAAPASVAEPPASPDGVASSSAAPALPSPRAPDRAAASPFPATPASPAPRPAAPPPPTPPSSGARPHASIGSAQVDGVLDRVAVRSVVRSLRPAVEACYAQAWARQAFEGELRVSLVIGGSGRATSVRVQGSTAARVGDCVRRAFTTASYPPSTASDAIVTVPITLRSY